MVEGRAMTGGWSVLVIELTTGATCGFFFYVYVEFLLSEVLSLSEILPRGLR